MNTFHAAVIAVVIGGICLGGAARAEYAGGGPTPPQAVCNFDANDAIQRPELLYDCAVAKAPGEPNLQQWIAAAVQLCDPPLALGNAPLNIEPIISCEKHILAAAGVEVR
jgi:hypothetical protein